MRSGVVSGQGMVQLKCSGPGNFSFGPAIYTLSSTAHRGHTQVRHIFEGNPTCNLSRPQKNKNNKKKEEDDEKKKRRRRKRSKSLLPLLEEPHMPAGTKTPCLAYSPFQRIAHGQSWLGESP